MAHYIALLRAINVGGHTVTMERLRALFEELGLARVETYIASGNVAFQTTARKPEALEAKIAAHLEQALGYPVATFLRSDEELAHAAAAGVFPAATVARAVAYNVGFLAAPLDAADRRRLPALATDVDTLLADGREVHWLCARKQSESTFSNAVLEKALGQRATFRSIKTIQALAAKYPPAGA